MYHSARGAVCRTHWWVDKTPNTLLTVVPPEELDLQSPGSIYLFSLFFWYLPKIGFTINIWFFKKITKFEIHQASKSSKETRWRFIFCNKKKRLKIVTIHKSRNFPWQTSGQQINLFWCWLISVVSGGLIFLLFGLKMTCLLKAM